MLCALVISDCLSAAVIRARMEALPKGQVEAARAIACRLHTQRSGAATFALNCAEHASRHLDDQETSLGYVISVRNCVRSGPVTGSFSRALLVYLCSR